MLVPLVAVIIFFAVYPQLALHRSERSVKAAVAPAQRTEGHSPAVLTGSDPTVILAGRPASTGRTIALGEPAEGQGRP